MNDRDAQLRPYFEALPDIIKYQIITILLLGIWLFLLGRLYRVLLNSAGRVAVTTGNFTFLFTTWQGILIILIALSTLFLYMALDLNAMVILSDNLIMGKHVSILRSCLQSVRSVSRLINLKGIGVAIYILLIAPVLGIGISFTLTQGFYIPTFISSVIGSTPLYLLLAIIAALFFITVGIVNLFILHGVVIDSMSVKEAGFQSHRIMKTNWKDFLNQNIGFILVMAAVLGIVALAVLFLPLLLVSIIPLPAGIKRGLLIYLTIQGIILSLTTDLIASPLYMMKMTQIYYKYKTGKTLRYKGRKIRTHRFDKYALVLAAIAVIAISVVLDLNFDRAFPLEHDVRIIAHRGGGNEGAENTVSGLLTAWKLGSYGSEIDIQRTKDGYYVVNHDSDFLRVAGDKRKPEEMTLEEVRSLSVDGEPVPTFEEMLEASKGRLILFTELKGETADHQMADDAIRIVKEYGMEEEVVFISLKYELIDYIETAYPEMRTGFLTFASFGDTSKLNCDYLGLEEESATADAIVAAHRQGKKVLIWTANKKASQRHFLCSQADGVITDNVSEAMELIEEIRNRSDLRRIIDRIREFLS